jgi:hypothetical protein
LLLFHFSHPFFLFYLPTVFSPVQYHIPLFPCQWYLRPICSLYTAVSLSPSVLFSFSILLCLSVSIIHSVLLSPLCYPLPSVPLVGQFRSPPSFRFLLSFCFIFTPLLPPW